ncbi:MAG: capsular polysaccharide synthesis protein [Oscillospiraceae bacterium]|nr:capsular polysaccharide synthesis protein [Oscillospiraceae bacterium]
MKQFMALFKKVGGKNVLAQYLRGHVLLFALVQTALMGFSKKSLEIVRLAVQQKIVCKLRKKYRRFIAEYVHAHPQPEKKISCPSDVIWTCWFQGLEAAPEIVKKCNRSLEAHITGKQIRVITLENYREYVQLPDYVEEKYAKGVIGPAHFSDLLRLELLTTHGGTWIDSTVLCTSAQIPDYMLDGPLFLFQTLKPGLDGHPTAISNWFMTAQADSSILNLTRALLHDYWKKHDHVVDYFIFHIFFQLATEAYPQEWKRVVPCTNEAPHSLLLRLFEPYDEQVYQGILTQSCFHKLTYKHTPEQAQGKNTYYAHLMKGQ